MDIPARACRPEWGEAGVLTKERGSLIAVDKVKEVALLVDRIEVDKEAHTRHDLITTHWTATGTIPEEKPGSASFSEK